MHEPILIQVESINDETVIIVGCPFTDGDTVCKGQEILEYETSKAVVSTEAQIDGFVAYACAVGDHVSVGAEVATVFDVWDERVVESWRASAKAAAEVASKLAWQPVAPAAHEQSSSASTTLFSLRAEVLIAQNRLDKALFGGCDFVTVQDVELVLAKRSAPKPAVPSGQAVRTLAGRRRVLRDRERIVVVCANQIAAEVVNDVLNGQDDKVIVGYVVDKGYRARAPLDYLDVDVFEFPEKFDRSSYDGVIIAMGGSLRSMRFRRKVFEHYRGFDVPFTNIISNTANIATGMTIGTGNIIEGGVYVGTHATLGDNNFISYATVIGHHNVIGSHNLFAPGVAMAGLVEVGDDCILPTGVNFMDRVRIGNRVILPLGYNVVSNLQDDTVVKMKNTD